MPLFIKKITDNLQYKQIDKETFNNLIDTLKTQYQEKQASLSIVKAQEKFITTQNKSPETTALLKTIDTITKDDFTAFHQKIFKKTQIQCLISGAIKKQLALELSDTIKNVCRHNPLSEFEKNKILFHPIKKSKGPYKIEIDSSTLGHATFLCIQDPHEFNLMNKAHMLVLEKILKESFFTELRTKQQTGYIVGSKSFEKDKQQFFCLFVHSTSHQPDDLLSRFDVFLEEQLRSFDKAVTKKRFVHIKNQITSLLEKPQDSLKAQSYELFHMLFEHKDIKRKIHLIENLKNSTYEDFKKFTIALLETKNRAKLAVLCKGKELKNKSYQYTPLE